MGKTIKFTFEEIDEYIKNFNCLLLSTEYKNRRSKLEIKFNCGHVRVMSFECFVRGYRCLCDSKNRVKRTVESKTRKKVLNALLSVNFKIISFQNNIASWGTNLTYECSNGHIETKSIREFMRYKRCVICHMRNISQSQQGEKGSNWQGGKTKLRDSLAKLALQWKKDSAKSCDYKCIITGERFDDIHHLHPLNLIIKEALENLNLNLFEFVRDYSEKDLKTIRLEIEELHKKYPLGVCLRKDVHRLFRKLYGYNDSTIEDFYEFKRKIHSGEIQIQNIKIGE